MKKSDITVGMTFYTDGKGDWGRNKREIKEVTVTSVGNIYFEISNRDKITIDTLKYGNKIYSHDEYQLYPTKKEITDKWELYDLKFTITQYFTYGTESTWWDRGKKLTLDQLRRIRDIISENNPPVDQ